MNDFTEITLNKLNELADNETAERKLDELRKMLQPVPPFPKNQLTDKAKERRINKSKNDFWYFDKTYFPEDIYDDYAAPDQFHKDMVKIGDLKDKRAHVIHGPRGFAKTLTFKKHFIWQFLFGKRNFMAVASSTLMTPQNFILDVIYSFVSNVRLTHDYELDWLEKSTEKLYARSEVNPKGTFVIALSEDRSSKGAQRMMERLDYVYITDYENRASSITKDAVEKRIDKLNEMRTSLSDAGVVIWEGNNFNIDCAMNLLFLEEEKGILSEHIEMHRFEPWHNGKSLWHNKYPAENEAELKRMCKPKDDYDWDGDYKGRPRRKSGDIFPDTYYNEWNQLPKDVRSVIYVDPNTSLKEKGDTTAINNLGFSISTQNFYITAARCRSYFRSNELLSDVLKMYDQELNRKVDVIGLEMDGNVTQESVWQNNILNFTQIHKMPFPYVQFRKYNVDQLATAVENLWKEGKFFFPPGFSKTEEGKEFLKQMFGFRLKKANKKDDAPDSIICAYTSLILLGIAYVLSDEPIMKSVSNRKVKRI